MFRNAFPSLQQDPVNLSQHDALVPSAAVVLWDEPESITVLSTALYAAQSVCTSSNVVGTESLKHCRSLAARQMSDHAPQRSRPVQPTRNCQCHWRHMQSSTNCWQKASTVCSLCHPWSAAYTRSATSSRCLKCWLRRVESHATEMVAQMDSIVYRRCCCCTASLLVARSRNYLTRWPA